MAEVLTPGCAVVTLSGTTDGPFPWTVTIHAEHPSGVSPIPASDLENLAASCGGPAMTGPLAALLPTSYTIRSVSARDVGEVRSPSVTLPLDVPGTSSGAVLPAAVAAVCIMGINPSAAQRKPGRISWPGVLESNATSSSDLTTAAVISYTSLAGTLVSQINGAGAGVSGFWVAVVRSTRLHAADRPVGVTQAIVSNFARLRLGTEVSRQRGRRTRR